MSGRCLPPAASRILKTPMEKCRFPVPNSHKNLPPGASKSFGKMQVSGPRPPKHLVSNSHPPTQPPHPRRPKLELFCEFSGRCPPPAASRALKPLMEKCRFPDPDSQKTLPPGPSKSLRTNTGFRPPIPKKPKRNARFQPGQFCAFQGSFSSLRKQCFSQSSFYPSVVGPLSRLPSPPHDASGIPLETPKLMFFAWFL